MSYRPVLVNKADTGGEGKTLEQMIEEKDRWLGKKKNVDNLLLALLDIIGYLHQHKGTHCDIKADNILVSKKTGEISLIDLDKCFTSGPRHKFGTHAGYGTDYSQEETKVSDFSGLGTILEELRTELPFFPRFRYRKFEKLCFKPDVYEGELYTILLPKKVNLEWMFWLLFLAVIIGGGIWIVRQYTGESETDTGAVRDANRDTIDMVRDTASFIGETLLIPDTASSGMKSPIKEPPKEPEKEPYKETEQHQLEAVIQNSYSNLAPILISSEHILDEPGLEHYDNILRNIEYIESYLEEDRTIAIESVKKIRPGWTDEKVMEAIENSDPYKKFVVQAARVLKDLRYAQEQFDSGNWQ